MFPTTYAVYFKSSCWNLFTKFTKILQKNLSSSELSSELSWPDQRESDQLRCVTLATFGGNFTNMYLLWNLLSAWGNLSSSSAAHNLSTLLDLLMNNSDRACEMNQMIHWKDPLQKKILVRKCNISAQDFWFVSQDLEVKEEENDRTLKCFLSILTSQWLCEHLGPFLSFVLSLRAI